MLKKTCVKNFFGCQEESLYRHESMQNVERTWTGITHGLASVLLLHAANKSLAISADKHVLAKPRAPTKDQDHSYQGATSCNLEYFEACLT